MRENTKETLQKFNIRPIKSLGQNFLIDRKVVMEIINAADINDNDLLIEIGPGLGSMTGELSKKAGKVVAIEIDKHLMPALMDNLKGLTNIEVINADILKINLKEIISKDVGEYRYNSVKIVANLPYYITTPIIMKLLEEKAGFDSMVFMVQKEVAERMVAKPGTKAYGALSVAVQYYSCPEIIFNVPPDCFIPKPEVESTIIILNIFKVAPVKPVNENVFFKVVKASFGQRRKTLVNALYNSGYFMQSKPEIVEMLKNAGVEEKQRGETLSIMQFIQMADAFSLKNS